MKIKVKANDTSMISTIIKILRHFFYFAISCRPRRKRRRGIFRPISVQEKKRKQIIFFPSKKKSFHVWPAERIVSWPAHRWTTRVPASCKVRVRGAPVPPSAGASFQTSAGIISCLPPPPSTSRGVQSVAPSWGVIHSSWNISTFRLLKVHSNRLKFLKIASDVVVVHWDYSCVTRANIDAAMNGRHPSRPLLTIGRPIHQHSRRQSTHQRLWLDNKRLVSAVWLVSVPRSFKRRICPVRYSTVAKFKSEDFLWKFSNDIWCQTQDKRQIVHLKANRRPKMEARPTGAHSHSGPTQGTPVNICR